MSELMHGGAVGRAVAWTQEGSWFQIPGVQVPFCVEFARFKFDVSVFVSTLALQPNHFTQWQLR